jgi:hypothetical protein
MIEWANDKILELTALVRGAGVLGAVAMVVYAYLKTRTFIAVLVAALTAGFFLWAINNTDWWQARVTEESGAPASAVVELPAPVEPEVLGPVDAGVAA